MTDPPSDLFGVPLKADPSVALPPLEYHAVQKTGPLYKVQYVIEFVGPRSVPAVSAAVLFSPQWFAGLGQPQCFCMRPSDLSWQTLTPVHDGSYDSLAVAWDLLTPHGQISGASAQHLLAGTERFSQTINRRPMPLPHPGEIDRVVTGLLAARDALDIGFAVHVMSHAGGFRERDLWVECARLGFDFAPGGSFDWRHPGHAEPLLSVTPIGTTDAFSLGNVQAGMVHDGVTVGFSVPLSIAPTQALDACFYTADRFAADLGGDVVDDEGNPVNERARQEFRANLKQALAMFSQLGITTGSAEALKLFRDSQPQ